MVCAPYVLAQYLKEINFRKKVYVVGAAAIAQELQNAGIRCIGVGVSVHMSGSFGASCSVMTQL